MYASVLHLWPVHYCATKDQSSVLPYDWWWSALSRFLTNRWANRASWQNSWLELIITADSQQSLAKPPFINSFIHLRKDVLTDGSTTLRCLCFTVDYLWLSNLSLSLVAQWHDSNTSNTQSAALHLMPPSETLSVTKAAWRSRGFSGCTSVLLCSKRISNVNHRSQKYLQAIQLTFWVIRPSLDTDGNIYGHVFIT